jgi:plasmid stabilization system protein ParE
VADDIVTRLREHALEGIWDFTKCSWDIQEAADEIERLRAFADHLAEAADIDRVRLMSRIIALEIGATNE